jgi:arginyl-tRNA synthetase
MGHAWSGSCSHVRFGQVLGMSTRRGTAVLLASLLDEARSLMLENQRQAKTTKIFGLEAEQSAECLGISSLIVNDLRHPRTQNYKFSWTKALSPRYVPGNIYDM